MKQTLTVRAKDPRHPVPRAGVPRSLDDNGKDTTHIGEEPVTVPNTLYYRKRIADGGLVHVDAELDPVKARLARQRAAAEEK